LQCEVLDIHFEDASGKVLNLTDGNEDPFIVKVAMTDLMKGLDPNSICVYYLHYYDEGVWPEICNTWVIGDYVYFLTTHFSDYMVAGVEKAYANEEGSNLDNSATEGNKEDSAAKSDESTDEKQNASNKAAANNTTANNDENSNSTEAATTDATSANNGEGLAETGDAMLPVVPVALGVLALLALVVAVATRKNVKASGGSHARK
jgi:hypothetical protein